MDNTLTDILEQLRAGRLDVAAAAELIEHGYAQPLGFATVDHHRTRRCGSAEAVFAEHKTAEQVAAIVRAIRTRGHAALVTRTNESHVAILRGEFAGDSLLVGGRGRTALVGAAQPTVTRAIPIVTAGTSDDAVAEEAELTCQALGHASVRVNDVGVAGLHRLGARLHELRGASAIICIAGMEGALPSVVGGLVDVPVIAVPTSIGYGAALGGFAALMGMLTSCAAGVVVVNIDNGFGAAQAACRINRLAQAMPSEPQQAAEARQPT